MENIDSRWKIHKNPKKKGCPLLKSSINKYGLENFNRKYKFDIVIDIGANIGEFSLAAVQHGCKKIYAFEPDPTCYVCLVKNSQNHQKKIKTMNFALSNSNKKTPFYLSGSSADSSLIKPIDSFNKIYLETHRLDEIAEIQALKKNRFTQNGRRRSRTGGFRRLYRSIR